MRAIISGASRGIGKEIAKTLAEKKYDLILIARSKKELHDLAKELKNDSIDIKTFSLDLSKSKSFEELNEYLKNLNSLDVLINNVGNYETDLPTEIEETDLKALLDINLFSAISLTKTALPLLRKSVEAKIINIGSVMSLSSNQTATSYSISKHALKAWNDAIREELRKENIGVSCLYPAAVNTSSWDGIQANRAAMIQAEDIAHLVGTILSLNHNCLVEEIRVSPMNFKP